MSIVHVHIFFSRAIVIQLLKLYVETLYKAGKC